MRGRITQKEQFAIYRRLCVSHISSMLLAKFQVYLVGEGETCNDVLTFNFAFYFLVI